MKGQTFCIGNRKNEYEIVGRPIFLALIGTSKVDYESKRIASVLKPKFYMYMLQNMVGTNSKVPNNRVEPNKLVGGTFLFIYVGEKMCKWDIFFL